MHYFEHQLIVQEPLLVGLPITCTLLGRNRSGTHSWKPGEVSSVLLHIRFDVIHDLVKIVCKFVCKSRQPTSEFAPGAHEMFPGFFWQHRHRRHSQVYPSSKERAEELLRGFLEFIAISFLVRCRCLCAGSLRCLCLLCLHVRRVYHTFASLLV